MGGDVTHGTCVTPNDKETINPASSALYTTDFGYFFSSVVPFATKGVVSPGFAVVSLTIAILKLA